MKALLFPGQGSQKAGMASEFEKNFKIVKEIFKRADETLNIKLSELILKEFNSSESKKKLNLGLQRSNNFSINEISKKYSDSFKKLLT